MHRPVSFRQASEGAGNTKRWVGREQVVYPGKHQAILYQTKSRSFHIGDDNSRWIFKSAQGCVGPHREDIKGFPGACGA